MLPRRWRRASVLIVLISAGCSTFSSVDDPPGDVDGGADAAAAFDSAADGPTTNDAPPGVEGGPPSSSFPIVLHFDAGSKECEEWVGHHGGEFEAIAGAQTGGGCQLCQDPATDPADPNPPFVARIVSPQLGKYSISGSFRRSATKAPTSALKIGFQIASVGNPGQNDQGSNPQSVAATADSWHAGNADAEVTRLTAGDGTPVVVSATIEMDPTGGGLTTDCYDVDDITIDFVPAK